MYLYENLFPHGNICKMLYFVIVPQLENAYRITVVMRRCITAADIYWKSLGQTNYSPLLGWIFLSLAVSLPGVFFFFFAESILLFFFDLCCGNRASLSLVPLKAFSAVDFGAFCSIDDAYTIMYN